MNCTCLFLSTWPWVPNFMLVYIHILLFISNSIFEFSLKVAKQFLKMGLKIVLPLLQINV